MTADSLRDRIAAALYGEHTNLCPGGLAEGIADALLPLVQAEKADVWGEGFAAGRNADHDPCWWPKNPYRAVTEEAAK